MEVPAARNRTGAHGKLPVMQEVRREAERRGIKLLILPTLGAIDALRDMDRTNAVLHVIVPDGQALLNRNFGHGR